ncbi:hypothetical protein D3C81_1683450 [compost metagenome]
MSGLNGLGLSAAGGLKWAILLIILLLGVILGRSEQPVRTKSWKTALVMALIFVLSLFFFNRITPFLYFNF